MSAILVKYAAATTIYFPLINFGSVSFSSTASLTTADSKISKNGAAFTTTSNAVASVGSFGYSLTLTTGDTTCLRAMIVMHHTAASPTFEDTMVLIDTYGNASAQHVFDLSIANQTVTASAGTVTVSAGTITSVTNSVNIIAGQVVTVGTNNDKTGYSLTQAFPSNFSALSITAVTGLVSISTASLVVAGTVNDKTGYSLAAAQVVTVGTNNDKTGYSLTQAFPSNFSALSISAVTGLVSISTASLVVAGTVSDKTGYSLTQTFPTNFSALQISATTGLVSISTASLVQCGTVANGVVTSIWSQAMVEPSTVPVITASVLSAYSWMFMLSKHTITQTSALQSVFKSDGSTLVASSTISDDGTTFSRGSFN